MLKEELLKVLAHPITKEQLHLVHCKLSFFAFSTGELEGEKKVSQKPFFLPRPSHAAVFDGGGGVFEAR
ncbi:MAG: hypothetical protein AAF849_24025, partial [Bacteroidota bacterium]